MCVILLVFVCASTVCQRGVHECQPSVCVSKCVRFLFFFHVKNNLISEEDTSICSSVLNAGMQRQNGPVAQLKINERKRVTRQGSREIDFF